MKKLFIFGVLVFSFFLMSTSYSQLLVEDFDYPVGDSIDTHGWTPHSGTGTTPVLVSNGGLTYADYLGSGIGNAADVFGTGEDVNKDFTVQGTDGSSIYMSALVNVTEAANSLSGGYFLHLGKTTTPTTFTSFCSRVFVSVDASDSVNFGLSNTSTGTYSSIKFVKNTTYLLIVKYTINTAGNDTTKLWVVSSGVPIDEITAGTPDVLIDSQTGTSTDSVNAVGIRQSSGIPDVVLDGIRVGTSWDDIFSVVSSPTISVAPTTLSGFTYVEGSGPSTSQSYKLSGSDLDPADGNITVTGSTNYEVSTDDINFSGSFDVAYTGGALLDTTIYVRLMAGLSTGDYNSETISNSGGGATTQDVTVDGSVTAEPVLSGDYYIPQGSNPQGFATLYDAVTTLNTTVVNGTVNFLLDADTLRENSFTFNANLSADNNVVVKPAPGRDVCLIVTPGASMGNGSQLIGFDKGHVTFDGSNDGSTSRNLIVTTETDDARVPFGLNTSNADTVVLKNLIIKNLDNVTLNFRYGAVINDKNDVWGFRVENCQIGTATRPVRRDGLAPWGTSAPNQFSFVNNEIYCGTRGVTTLYLTESEIIGNTINVLPTTAGATDAYNHGIYITGATDTINIKGNTVNCLEKTINASSYLIGIAFAGNGGAENDVINVVNNMVNVGAADETLNTYGIGLRSAQIMGNLKIYYNTIVVNDNASTLVSYGIGNHTNGTGSVDIDLEDNIIINNQTGNTSSAAIGIIPATSVLSSNYNDLLSATATLVNFQGTTYADLFSWQTATSQDLNSVSKPVNFVSATDLHLTGASDGDFDLAGTPVAGITTDIDGDTRSTTYPYMGADEGTISLTEPVDFWVEDFDYPDGDTLTNFNGWVAHSAAGTNPITINPFGLAFPDYKSSGIGLAALMDNTSEDVHKLFPSVSNGTVYTSFMVRVDAAPTGYFLHFAPNPHNTFDFRGRVWVKTNGSGGLAIGYSYSSSDTTFTDFDYNLGDTLLFVSKYEVVAGDNNDIVSLYIFNNSAPAPSTEPVSPTVGPIVNATTSADIDPGSINLRQYNSGQNIIVDGIRVATSWNDVFGIVSGVEITESKIPTDYTLTQNYPNPFNPTTRINYSVPFDSKVTISVYSITGELVAELVNDYKSVGTYSVNFDGSNLASGMYIYRMVAGSFVQTNKMMLLK